MTIVEDHEHNFVLIVLSHSELRERCTLCTAVRIIPNPGDSDEELHQLIAMGANSNMDSEIWFGLVARAMQLQYERETGLPAFAGSQEYADWLKRRGQNINGQ